MDDMEAGLPLEAGGPLGSSFSFPRQSNGSGTWVTISTTISIADSRYRKSGPRGRSANGTECHVPPKPPDSAEIDRIGAMIPELLRVQGIEL